MKRTLSVVLCLFLSVSLFAQSPYRRALGLDLPLTIGGLGGYSATHFLSKRVKPLTEAQISALDARRVWAFDRGATRNWSTTAAKVSDVTLLTSIASPLLLLADPAVRNDWKTVSLMGLETFAINGFLTDLTKVSAHRTRPYNYNPNAPLDEKLKRDARFSFFSGHTSTSAAMCFFTAKIYNDFHPDSKAKPFVWATAALIPAVTGLMRYKAGKHFPTDIITGYLIGAAVGILVPEVHRHLK